MIGCAHLHITCISLVLSDVWGRDLNHLLQDMLLSCCYSVSNDYSILLHLKVEMDYFECIVYLIVYLLFGWFLAQLSRRLKWAFPNKICPLSVVVVVVVVVNFSHFHLLLQNQWANFNQSWHKASLGKGDSSLYKWRAPPFSKGR